MLLNSLLFYFQKERCDKIRIFSVWKLKHNDQQSQVFTLKMADKFHKRALMGRVWAGWRSVVENTWKRRVEKACQVSFFLSFKAELFCGKSCISFFTTRKFHTKGFEGI